MLNLLAAQGVKGLDAQGGDEEGGWKEGRERESLAGNDSGQRRLVCVRRIRV